MKHLFVKIDKIQENLSWPGLIDTRACTGPRSGGWETLLYACADSLLLLLLLLLYNVFFYIGLAYLPKYKLTDIFYF